MSKVLARIGIGICIAVFGAFLVRAVFLSRNESGSFTAGQAGDEPKPHEGLHEYRQRMVEEAGAAPGAAPSTLYVLAYLYLDENKCVSINPGVLSLANGHIELTYYAFAEDTSEKVFAVLPYLKHSVDGFRLPEFEVPSSFDAVPNTDPNHLLTYGPNAALVADAEEEGLKQVKPALISELSSNHLFGSDYQARWNLVNSYTPYVLDEQLILPTGGADDGACLSYYHDGRSIWKRYIYPGAKIKQIDEVNLTISTNATAEEAAAYYRRLSGVYVWDVNGEETHLSQSDINVEIDERDCRDCDRTTIKMVGEMREKYIEERDEKSSAPSPAGP